MLTMAGYIYGIVGYYMCVCLFFFLFGNILDVIKTQPYDLLRWSLEYFRCLQMGVPPPVKKRLEKTLQYGTLTRGYLKILLDQVSDFSYI